MTTLMFDEQAHRYTLDGRVVPHVTQIIEGAMRFAGVPEATLERARARGTALHRAIELDLRHELDESSLGPDTAPCLAQFREFQRTTGFRAALTEWRGYSARYGYAGTIDSFGRLNSTARGRYALIDWKRTASLSPVIGLQLAAYEGILAERFEETRGNVDRYALQLGPDRWKLVRYDEPGDAAVFAAALTLWRYCNVHKFV